MTMREKVRLREKKRDEDRAEERGSARGVRDRKKRLKEGEDILKE